MQNALATQADLHGNTLAGRMQIANMVRMYK